MGGPQRQDLAPIDKDIAELGVLRTVTNPSPELLALIKEKETKLCDNAAAAIERNDIETLKSIIDADPSVVNARTSKKDVTLLRLAVYFSKKFGEGAMKVLLQHPSIDVNAQNRDGMMCALHTAAAYNRQMVSLDGLKLLLSRPEIDVNVQSRNGYTPFFVALYSSNGRGTEEAVEIFLRHPDVDVNICDYEFECPLNYAIRCIKVPEGKVSVSERVVEMLLLHPNIDPNVVNKFNRTPLMTAAMSIDRHSSLELLLSHPKTDIMKQTPDGKTAVDLCPTVSGKLLIWKAWYRRHANVNNDIAHMLAVRSVLNSSLAISQLLDLARQLGVPPATVDNEWKALSQGDVYKNVSDVLDAGGVWNAKQYAAERAARPNKRRRLQSLRDRFRQGVELATGVTLQRDMKWGEIEDCVNEF